MDRTDRRPDPRTLGLYQTIETLMWHFGFCAENVAKVSTLTKPECLPAKTIEGEA
jgi:hypothetical protein